MIVGRRRNVVSKTEAIVGVFEIHIKEPLVSTVERDSSVCHGHQGIVIAEIRGQNHDTGVEQVRPSNIGRGRKAVRKIEKLVGGSVRNDIGIEVNNLPKLGLLP